MGETIPTWKPTCNPSVSVRLSGRKTRSDGGAFLLREVMERSGICEQLGQQLQDHRDPSRVRHSLTRQLRTLMIQQAQGWDDLSDTQLLGEDPVFQLINSLYEYRSIILTTNKDFTCWGSFSTMTTLQCRSSTGLSITHTFLCWEVKAID